MSQLFGTDGVRGLANDYPMTTDMAMQIGRAVAHYFRSQKDELRTRKAKIVIGKDTRLSGYMIEQALAAGICSMGADVLLVGPLPTPGISYITHSMRADAGIVISASHNPYYDNGIKVFGSDGYKLPDDVQDKITKLVKSEQIKQDLPTKAGIGKAFRIDDAVGRYVVYLKSTFPTDLNLEGMRAVVDCANGAAYKVAPCVFRELGAEIIPLGVEPNGMNINFECGSLEPSMISRKVNEFRADVGIALDGDGDRLILADENGEIIDGDQILGICAMDMKERGMLKGDTLVVTPMSNLGLTKTLEKYGINVIQAPVGDRYVVNKMREFGYSLGGEQSGHLIFLNYSTTGDGVLAALRALELMQRKREKLSSLVSRIRLFPQVQENVSVRRKEPLENLPEVQKLIKKAEESLGDRGRVFVRYSGTEPLARVMLEGEESSQIKRFARDIAGRLAKDLS
jgi:phosphoglucosamine mutase